MADETFNGSVYLNDPDVRYGVSFLSNKYRNNAVRGEVMMDKATGEIFLRRTTDGRVVSFQQGHVDLNDILFDLRVMLASNTSFSTPTNLAFPDSCYVTMDFDLMRMNDNEELDITSNNITSNVDSSTHMIYFQLAKNTNGFGFKMMPRDTDRGIISWATATYNSVCKLYNGTNADILAEKQKFSDLSNYDEADARIYYDVIITNQDGTTTAYSFDACVAMAAVNTIVFPENFPVGELTSSKAVYIKISSIEFDKLHFVLAHYKEFNNSEDYIAMYDKIKPADDHIYFRYCTVSYYIDSVNDLILTGNNFITSVISTATVDAYLAQMNSITSDVPILFTPLRPSDGLWSQNALWLEQSRDVGQGSEEVIYDSETSFKQLEDYLAGNPDDSFIDISTMKEENTIFIKKIT